MKEIKFRAWEKNLKEMIPVQNIDFEKKMINTDSAWRLFDEIELMQYTGICDCNGKEIYEGDILPYRSVVTYVDASDPANLGMEAGFYAQRDNFESWRLLEVGEELEVLGNIYKNLELLNK